MKKIYCLIILAMGLNIGQTNGQLSMILQHNDLRRTGWMYSEEQLTQANVNANSFGKLFSRSVDDQIYTQPLVLSNLKIKGKYRDVVFVATVNNSVYAFDAVSDTANAPIWQTNLTPPGYRPIKNSDMSGACFGNYKDFSGNMGIVGTPAIDTNTKTLYIVARSVTTNTPKTYVQYLHAIDIRTGAEKPGSPVYITATVNGSGAGSVGGKITFDQQKQNQRAALLLYKGVVYIAWASHCDWGNYHGWFIGYDAQTLQQKYVYNDTPEGKFGGIWMSGQGPAVDEKGNIYISTGNGTVGRNSNPNDTINRGESLLKLSTASGNLKVTDFFTPKNYKEMEQGDLDYGVDGVMLIPETHLSLSGSKESLLYLINNNSMGGNTPDNSNVLQTININAEKNGDHHLHGSPVYFMDNNRKEYIYAWAEGGLLKQIPFIRAAGKFDTASTITGVSGLPPGMPGAMLAVSSNKLKPGTGILWASHPLVGDANHKTVPGVLQAFDASDVTHELWSSDQNPRDSIGNFAKFVCPTIVNGKVYMSTFSNKLLVYGLLSASAGNDPEQATAIKGNGGILELFPNPTAASFTLRYQHPADNAHTLQVQLINSDGITVFAHIYKTATSLAVINIEVTDALRNGLYIVWVKDEDGIVTTGKIVIER